ncbi:MAG: 16S rRNA (cytosine(967)-C(5))-methyltransferase RsmB [Desulfitobacteriaceae bacterium]
MNSRSLTVHILSRVEEEGAYANILLQHNLGLLTQARDRQLVTSLVNGTLKHRLTLDYALRRHLRKPMSSLPVPVRGILRSGAFQLLFLDRIPPAVAVHESVELAKTLEPKFSALVNGVLRKVQGDGWDLAWPDVRREPVRYLSVRYSHPEWMVHRWWKRWGLVETEKLCQVNNEPAPTWIRTNSLKITPEELSERLKQEGVAVERGTRVPESLHISGFGALDHLSSFQEGLFTVQDESSQIVAHVLAPEPGDRVLDACSAPGGKTTHLAQIMQDQGQILAFDIHEHKLRLIEGLAKRLGIHIIQAHVGDARELPGVEEKSQDRVLVDAPCSGLGVLRRKADIRWQKGEEELKEFPPLQLAILERAAATVSLGGDLVYATCTLEPEENFEVVKAFRLSHPEFAPVDLTASLPFSLSDERDQHQAEKGMLQLLPHRHGTDGFFLAKFRRCQV